MRDRNKLDAGMKVGGLFLLRKATQEEKEKCHPNKTERYYLCECQECRNFFFIGSSYIANGNQSCGCNSLYIKENQYTCVPYNKIYNKK